MIQFLCLYDSNGDGIIFEGKYKLEFTISVTERKWGAGQLVYSEDVISVKIAD